MARGIEGNEIATPRTAPKKTGGSTQKSGAKQQSIAGFFTRTPGPAPSKLAVQGKTPSFNTVLKEQESSDNITPIPSSLPAQFSSPHPALESSQPGPANTGRNKENGKIRPEYMNGVVANMLNRDSRYPPVQPEPQSQEEGQLL
jgi:DNA mismatch repair protein MSH6